MEEESWPSIWTLVRSWLTPAILFVLLNLVIGTIALTSKSLASHRRPEDPVGDGRTITRTVSSDLPLLHSLRLSRLLSGDFHFNSHPAAAAVHHESGKADDPSPDPKASEKKEEHRFYRSQSVTRSTPEEEAAPVSLTKSASERPAIIGRFEEKKAAMTKTKAKAKAKAAVEEEVEHEVDARADNFINQFRQQLHLQRQDSLLSYEEMLGRGK